MNRILKFFKNIFLDDKSFWGLEIWRAKRVIQLLYSRQKKYDD